MEQPAIGKSPPDSALAAIQDSVQVKQASIGLDQVKMLAAMLGQFAAIEHEINGTIKSWLPRYLRRVGMPFSWSWAYEFTLAEQLAMMLVTIGSMQMIHDALRSPDPVAQLLEHVENYEPDFSMGKPKMRHIAFVLILLLAMFRNIRAIEYHSLSLDELVARGVKRDPLALRRAVAIDPTVLAMPSVTSYVSMLVTRGDKRAVKALHAAAAKGPNRQLDPNRRLRYLERVMHEGKTQQRHSREDVFRTITEQLRLYEAKKGDPFKALFTLFDRWREDATT